ncbi:Dihydroflavonol-4-reductase [Dactylellina cionopaga]|nr:Dihydroflavonol-4-reductase [Dactylellina cionopaga]
MSSKPIALLTGINGYIAGWVAVYLLDAGYKVRGTSRSQASAQPVIDALVSKGYSASDIEIYEVADITAPGAFDEAVKDVQVVTHLAAPVSMNFTDPEPVIRVAKESVVSILRSAKAHGNNLKTFVHMSSIVAIWDPTFQGKYTFSEKDWNDVAFQITQKLGKSSPGPIIYSASKAEAERDLWKFRDEEKPAFNIVSINPGWVSGAPVVPPKDASKIGETIRTIWGIFSGQKEWAPLGGFPTYVHVYDVARLFVWAAQNGDKNDGERFLAVAGRGSEQAIQDILREAYPNRRDVISEGEKGKGYNSDYSFFPDGVAIETSKAVKATGQDWIKYDQVVLDTAKGFEHLVEL